MVIFKIIQSDGGLARLELGRSRYRYPTSPSYIPTIAFSLHYMIIPEMPLYFNLSTAMGLMRFDSDDDDEGDLKNLYVFNWRPQARALAIPPTPSLCGVGSLQCVSYAIVTPPPPLPPPSLPPFYAISGRRSPTRPRPHHGPGARV